MTVKGAKTGKIIIGSSDLAEVKNWKFGKSGNNKTYNSSSTAGHQKTVAGPKSGSVSFDLILDQDDAIEERIKVGDLVSLELYTDDTRNWIVPARIASVDDEVNIEEGEPPTVSVEADTHGAWTYPDGSVST